MLFKNAETKSEFLGLATAAETIEERRAITMCLDLSDSIESRMSVGATWDDMLAEIKEQSIAFQLHDVKAFKTTYYLLDKYWLHGKSMTAFLAEVSAIEGESHSP